MAYKIIEIKEDSSVDVSFDCDNKVQNISNLPVGNQEELNLSLENYEEAYINGLKLEGKIKE